eukprot:CAMPEP_0179483374 /NCGR_PEP_ID=MMETSP0799-20121207/60595_1 /TAXON_ID=46947 /ORGANISM="Geminigera cryophila, Strain CCMP2564" /LENGTH=187 /DNA_ID=CAMNT_0021296903 /DNA_START=94 /DNA_END=655 /DNA_ORIENTATION=-
MAAADTTVMEEEACRVHKSFGTPAELKKEVLADQAALEVVANARAAIRDILDDKEKRLLVVAGLDPTYSTASAGGSRPMYIHDRAAALEYASKLAPLAHELKNELVIVMRTYFEKPRSSVGWQGLINDPHLNDTFDMANGLKLARSLLVDINKLGLPCACEFLDPIVPSYISGVSHCNTLQHAATHC